MFRPASNFDKYLDRATSEKLLDPDWEATLLLCDSIRSGETAPKVALTSIKKKLYHPNPHVNIAALNVLESCVKNCGSLFHMELATRPFMDELREIAKMTQNDKLKNKILEQIQLWAHAFRNDSSCRAVGETLNAMKAEGFKFPALKESDAMFSAETAPQWADGDNCHRCRVTFSLVNRKHHCRCCGQIFCDKCSARTSAIPKYGIEKEVRVCDDCYDKLNKTTPLSVSKPVLVDPPPAATSAKNSTPKASAPTGKSEQELREEEELQLAIALSKSEAESREKNPRRNTSSYTSSTTSAPASKSAKENGSYAKVTEPASVQSDPIADRERERYLDREYWEQKKWEQQPTTKRRSSSPAPSAPATFSHQPVAEVPVSSNSMQNMPVTAASPEVDDRLQELTNFTTNLKKTLDIFTNRMQANQLRMRPIANDSAVQSLFLSVTNMHSQLIRYIQEEEEKRMGFEALQDKLSDISVARGALDMLREEHRERKRREAEAQEAIRQQQMAQKLDVMRKQKQEYLQYQRQLAMQRVQDQERELQMRKEQQKYIAPGIQQPPPQQPVQQPVHQQVQQPVQWPQPAGPPPNYYPPPNHGLPAQQPAPVMTVNAHPGHYTSPFPSQSLPYSAAGPTAYLPPTHVPVQHMNQMPAVHAVHPQMPPQPQPQYQNPVVQQQPAPVMEEPLITFD